MNELWLRTCGTTRPYAAMSDDEDDEPDYDVADEEDDDLDLEDDDDEDFDDDDEADDVYDPPNFVEDYEP